MNVRELFPHLEHQPYAAGEKQLIIENAACKCERRKSYVASPWAMDGKVGVSVFLLLQDRPDIDSIPRALMQLLIRQHLHIMLAAVRLSVKYHREDEESKQKYICLLK